MYGLILACRELGIPTVDMQHGGQGRLHPAYTFRKDNLNDFNTLPDYFWVWDSPSKNHLSTWLKISRKKIIVGGNPWINFLAKERKKTSSKNIICTLTIGLDQIIPKYLIKAIRISPPEYKWFLRLHPRTSRIDRTKFYQLIRDHQLESKTNVKEANSLPLPILLMSAWAHVTHSSGSLLEAALLGIDKNVVTSDIGKVNYKELIAEEKAAFYDEQTSGDLFSFLSNMVLPGSSFVGNVNNYKYYLDEIIKKNKSFIL